MSPLILPVNPIVDNPLQNQYVSYMNQKDRLYKMVEKEANLISFQKNEYDMLTVK